MRPKWLKAESGRTPVRILEISVAAQTDSHAFLMPEKQFGFKRSVDMQILEEIKQRLQCSMERGGTKCGKRS
jgi:hypothetical protein